MSGGMTIEDLRSEVDRKRFYAEKIIDILGLNPTESNAEHMALFLVMMNLYDGKNAIHNDTWQRYGWRDSLMHMRSKLKRTEQQFEQSAPPNDVDDPMDLINYTMFFLRNLMAHNRNGTEYNSEEAKLAEVVTQVAMNKDDPRFVAAIQEALR
jgi:hypothetical protein